MSNEVKFDYDTRQLLKRLVDAIEIISKRPGASAIIFNPFSRSFAIKSAMEQELKLAEAKARAGKE